MKIVYLPSARRDLTWFRKYYGIVFKAGANKAFAHYRSAIGSLKAYPMLGQAEDDSDIRKLGIAGTPFSIYYKVEPGEIQVLRVFDHRAAPESLRGD